jgi:hypothetical protein
MEESNIEINDFNNYSLVEGNSNLVRDNYSKGIVNVNESEYKTYIETYKRKHNELQKIKKMESEIGSIKNDLDEIKDLLKDLLRK